MKTGNPSVAFLVQIDDGQALLGETSLRLFLTAAKMFRAKYCDPTAEPEGPVA
jgi:hypothetical protein